MSITEREVRQIALLAKLELSEDELREMADDLGAILGHMEELEGVDLGAAAAIGGVSTHVAPFRDDVPGADPLQRDIGDFAPARSEGFFLVPRLAALDADAAGAEASS